MNFPYQRKPNTKRKTKAAMNAKMNFFQFIIFSVEVSANPKDPGTFIAKWRPACRYKLQLSCSFDTTPRLPRRVCGPWIQCPTRARAASLHRDLPPGFLRSEVCRQRKLNLRQQRSTAPGLRVRFESDRQRVARVLSAMRSARPRSVGRVQKYSRAVDRPTACLASPSNN